MATGSVESWSQNVADLGPVYPFVGSEWLWLIIGVAFWIGWHVWQLRFENDTYRREAAHYKGEALLKAIRGDH